MSVRVSVVIATFNSGPELARTVESVRRQSVGLDTVELILVDDGSTDGHTPQRVRELGAKPWITSLEIPNSGWPSRPRNTGLAVARGDYVLFMDHDDLLYPKAVERMLAAADADDADLVVGKEVRTGGRTMGLDAFRANLSRAQVMDDHLATIPTPHKMFRTRFLLDHDLRFPEHLSRLEDHHLLASVFVHDPAVSVVADYPCYQWIIHDANNSLRLPDPTDYFRAVREVLDLVDRWPYGERVRNDAYRLWERVTVLDRLSANGLRAWPEGYQQEFFAAARALLVERFDPALDHGLRAADRARAVLFRTGDLPAVLRHVEVDSHVTTRPRVVAATAAEDVLTLDLQVRLEAADGPLTFERRSDGLLLGRSDRPDARQALTAQGAQDVTAELDLAGVEVMLTHRSTNAEWFQPTAVTGGLVGSGADLEWAAVGTATIAPATALMGNRITPGIWDVKARTTAFGYDSRVALRIDAEQVPAAVRVGGLVVTPYLTQGGRLALKVAKATTPLPEKTPKRKTTVRKLAARLRKTLG